MKVDGARVRRLREERCWSQEHLATVAGLSLRTVQRVESEGSASAESRMAIASAFGLAPDGLSPAPAPAPVRQGRFPARRLGLAMGIGGAILGTTLGIFGVIQGGGSPEEQGTAFAFIGVTLGLSCAVIGILSNRFRSS